MTIKYLNWEHYTSQVSPFGHREMAFVHPPVQVIESNSFNSGTVYNGFLETNYVFCIFVPYIHLIPKLSFVLGLLY